ncbi:hypothetical protein V1509DRAFT_622699 [Lipomyces kononenkoae]
MKAIARESLGHKIVAPVILIVGIIILVIIGLYVFRVVGAVLLSVNRTLATSSIKISSRNVSIPVHSIPHERYVDITTSKLHSLWMNSSAPGFKSRYWTVRDRRPHQHEHHKNHIDNLRHNYWHRSSADFESDSVSMVSPSSESTDPEDS